jgi:hypothetical protein
MEPMESHGAFCDTFRVKLYGKLHFLKRLKAEYAGDIRFQEALRKEFETGYRLEHPNLARYISLDDDRELDRLMDAAYSSTIATFCDSVFPSLTVGRQWEKASSEFHAQSLQVAADIAKKYPDIPESVIIQHAESRFHSLVGYVFNRMRENGLQQ